MPDTGPSSPACIACGRTDGEVPLIAFAFRGHARHICPQHLPVLIHDPTRLAGMLPGADGLEAADHHD
jgi:hypothetical protein